MERAKAGRRARESPAGRADAISARTARQAEVAAAAATVAAEPYGRINLGALEEAAEQDGRLFRVARLAARRSSFGL